MGGTVPILKPRTTVITLLQGDDIDPAQDFARKVEEAARGELQRRVGDDEATGTAKATEAFNEFMEGAEKRSIRIELTALSRKEYRKLLGEHPPRIVPSEDNATALHEQDAAYGFNFDTLGDYLLPASITSVTSPEGQWDGDNADLLDGLSDGQFSELYSAAVSLNQGRSMSPKARLSSPVDRTSEETSNSPDRLG